MSDPKVCVISLIGKSQFMQNQTKAWKLNNILQRNAFKVNNKCLTTNLNKRQENQQKPTTSKSSDDLNESIKDKDQQHNDDLADDLLIDNDDTSYDDDDVMIEAYFDDENNILYTNLESLFDTNNIIDVILNENFKNSSFFKLWEHEQIKYVKAVLLLFSISHIIIVSHPTMEFDIGYIRFFRTIDVLRNKLLPSIVDLMKSLNLQITKEWIYAGRPCSPRVLFSFENCPKDILNDSEAKITKLERHLEDQIYNSLKKSYVISNISNSSLFAIPANNTFVYIHRINNDNNIVNKYLLSNIKSSQNKSSTITSSTAQSTATNTNATSNNSIASKSTSTTSRRHSYQSNRRQSLNTIESNNNITPTQHQYYDPNSYDTVLFKDFIYQHVNIAFKDGFNDNIGRNNINSIFELPKLSIWCKLFDTFYEAFFNKKSAILQQLPALVQQQLLVSSTSIGNTTTATSSTNTIEQKINNFKTKLSQSLGQIQPNIDMDVKFSINRCKKILPIALNVYQDNLPQHYTRQQHNLRLEKATKLYSLNARGPMYKKYLKKLENDCLNIWRQGRQLCEATSLTGNPCTNEMHNTVFDTQTVNDSNIPIKMHDSKVITMAASNCGFYQKERYDPFHLKDANYTFYQNFNQNDETNKKSLSKNRRIITYDFPVFKSLMYKAAGASGDQKPTATFKVLTKNQSNQNDKNNASEMDNHNNNNVKIDENEKNKASSTINDLTLLNTENLSVNNLSQDNNANNNNNNNDVNYIDDNYGNYNVNVDGDEEGDGYGSDDATNEDYNYDDENVDLKVNNEDAVNDENENETANNNETSILNDLFSSKLTLKTTDGVKQQLNSPSIQNELLNTEQIVASSSANIAIQNNTVTASTGSNISSIVVNNNNNNNASDKYSYKLETQMSSKTDYLEGMTHSECQPGILPLFSSWSLCSIGKYSDYSQHSGLQQPGFLPGHNYLVPWDITLKSEHKIDKKKSKYLSNSLSNKKDSQTKDGSSIRIYIGMEYECPLGHRFICSAPDRLVKVASNGLVKDDASKLVNGDMPLYKACPCRSGKEGPSYMAQMMRVFVAVPPLLLTHQQNDSSSAPVHILLQPKVQPNPPPCPIFRPSYEGPIKLADNSIWILRMPYIYMGDDEPYYRPKDFETLNNCRVLKGMFSFIEK